MLNFWPLVPPLTEPLPLISRLSVPGTEQKTLRVLVAEMLPARSMARTPIKLVPGARASSRLQAAVPVAIAKEPEPTWHSTRARPTLSLAVPVAVTVVLVRVSLGAGELMATVGGVRSGPAWLTL